MHLKNGTAGQVTEAAEIEQGVMHPDDIPALGWLLGRTMMR